MKRAVGVEPTEISATSTLASRSCAAMEPRISLRVRRWLRAVLRGRAVAVTGVAQQSEKAQARALAHRANIVDDRGRVGIDAAAMKADVNFHEHIELPFRGDHRGRPRRGHVAVVHDDREANPAIEQRNDARGVGGIDRIGQPDVGNTRLGEHFSLAELRAAHASRAGVELHLRNGRALVRLRVRSQTHARARRERLHRGDVVLETRAIDEDSGSRDGGEIHVGSEKFPGSGLKREVVTPYLRTELRNPGTPEPMF